MIKVAITGSSGSGKTTISKMFLEFEDTFLINADDVARKMASEDKIYLQEIVDYFGIDILDEMGNLNRKKLSYIIAKNEEAHTKLNEITKKNIIPKIDRIILDNCNKKMAIIDVPVLYENKLESYFDVVVAVISNKEEQIKRICSRDNLSVDEANLRLNMQLDNAVFKQKADFVIYNFEKTVQNLKDEVSNIYNIIEGKGF